MTGQCINNLLERAFAGREQCRRIRPTNSARNRPDRVLTIGGSAPNPDIPIEPTDSPRGYFLAFLHYPAL
jgi:hypothetical protein